MRPRRKGSVAHIRCPLPAIETLDRRQIAVAARIVFDLPRDHEAEPTIRVRRLGSTICLQPRALPPARPRP
jgi:hypothetical protein